MNVQETLDILYQLCKEDGVLRRKLLATRNSKNPAAEFCKISAEYGQKAAKAYFFAFFCGYFIIIRIISAQYHRPLCKALLLA